MERHRFWNPPGKCSGADINDLPGAISGLIKLFADDAKRNYAIDSEQKVDMLQNYITRSENWAEIWEMLFNLMICHHMHLVLEEPHQYTMDSGENQEIIETVKKK